LLGSLLLGYYDDAGRLHYAGRVGTGFTAAELARLEGC
jgi:bifunctional non-homologous end joining protein LigD